MNSQTPPLIGFYDHWLVVLSVVIAILASYAALDLAGRVTAARGHIRLLWLGGWAFAMGIFLFERKLMNIWDNPQARLLAAIFHHKDTGLKQCNIPAEFVDEEALDAGLLLRIQQLNGAEERGKDASAVDVAYEKTDRISDLGQQSVRRRP